MTAYKHEKPKESPKKKIAATATLTLGTTGAIPIITATNAEAAPMSSWDRIAACESGDMNTPNSGRWNLSYGHADSTGGLQIQTRTWNDFKAGISTAAHAYLASKEDQIKVAEKILAAQGPNAWVCNLPGHGIASGALSSVGTNASVHRGGADPFAGQAPAQPAPKPVPAKPAPPAAPKPDAPKAPGLRHHTVVEGDTLYGISIRHKIGDGGLDTWKPLYVANKDKIKNPHLIYPGQKLRLPGAPAGKAPAQPVTPSKPAPPATPVPGNEVLTLVNAERAKVGAAPLVADATLNTYAANWSAKMAAEGRMYHSNLSFPGSPRGENVAHGYRSAAAVVQGWMNSPGHRANILNKAYTKMGVGQSGTYWTQVFAGGRVSAPAPAPAATAVLPTVGRIGDGLIVGAGGSMSRSAGGHSGLDISAPTGTKVVAAMAGEVVGVGGAGAAYGNHVIVKHGPNLYTLYAHLSTRTAWVGMKVSAGQQIGNVGSTGQSSGPHLHFEVRTHPTTFNASVFLNPVTWLRSHGVKI